MKKIIGQFILLILFLPLVIMTQSVGAIDCLNDPINSDADRSFCEEELKKREQEAKDLAERANVQKQNQAGINADISKLNSQISRLKGNINKKDSQIRNLGGQINEREGIIDSLEDKINRERVSLSQILRKQHELDSVTLTEFFLSSRNIADFYQSADNYISIQNSMHKLLGNIRDTQSILDDQKRELLVEKKLTQQEKQVLEQDKKVEEVKKQAKNTELSKSERIEQTLTTLQREKEAEAAIIRNRLFKLIEIDGGGIPFGHAVKYADVASKKTGVKSAFILAILKQETNLGSNIGSCYLDDTNTGAGVGKNTGRKIANVMKPTRDVAPFLRVTKQLGLDYRKTPVSCPASYGYGGAMGPSQFIPSTWEYYQSRIASAVGVSTPNPWNPQHAIMATALYLKNVGGAKSGGERTAACKYYSGRACTATTAFYGNSVVSMINSLQRDIDAIK